MQIPVKTTRNKFFREYVELMNPVLRLRKRDLDVLSELLYYNDKLKDLSPKNRWTLIFNYENKVEISNKLKMSKETFATHLTELRKKNIIVDNKVVDMLCINPGKSFNVQYKFVIRDERTTDKQNIKEDSVGDIGRA